MESDKSAIVVSTMEGNGNKIQLVLTVIALLLAVVAIILGFIGISQKGTTNISIPAVGTATGTDNDRIWAIAIGHGSYNHAYIDEASGELRGFLVDMANAVCKTANKNCRVVYDVWNRCWDSEAGQVARGGIGLMSQWYDGCAGWVQTYDRSRTYDFSEAFSKPDSNSLFAKPGSSPKSDWKDMNGKTIGVLDGWSTDEFCIRRNADQFTGGVPFVDANFMHFAGPEDLVKAINNDEVDFAFLGVESYVSQELERVDGNPDLPCEIQGPSMMVRKVDKEFADWLNPALVQLKRTNEYKTTICNDLEEAHGHQPGLNGKESCFL